MRCKGQHLSEALLGSSGGLVYCGYRYGWRIGLGREKLHMVVGQHGVSHHKSVDLLVCSTAQ
jgi:hypothetical protein